MRHGAWELLLAAALASACSARNLGGGGLPAGDAEAADVVFVDATLPDVVFPDVVFPDVASPDIQSPDVVVPSVDVSTARDLGPSVDTGAAPGTYPAGPYGSRVGSLFEPFALNACNRRDPDTVWRFDGADFFTSNVTVVLIVAGWSVPDQMLTRQVETEIVQRYAGRGVRVVQVLEQDSNRQPVGASFCNTWVSRYALSIPVLMDPMNTLGAYYPNGAFPGILLVDRSARLRAREYGVNGGLTSIRALIDDVLANPNG